MARETAVASPSRRQFLPGWQRNRRSAGVRGALAFARTGGVRKWVVGHNRRMNRGVAVAATGPASADAGMSAAAAGGNAVDAAIAAIVAAMTTEPGIVSILGGAFVTVWPADGDPEVIDGNVEMPGRGVARERF